jgi:hypothetical protein
MITFKVRAHQMSQLVGDSTENKPLTEKQIETLAELKAKIKTTDKQAELIQELEAKHERSKDCTLSVTAKTLVRKIWLNNNFGFKKHVVTDILTKGLTCEQDAMQLVQDVLGGEFRIKNVEKFENEYSTGVPDSILKKVDFVEDIKNAWDLETFFNAEYEHKGSYWWQGQTYMNLTGKNNYRIIHCLVPTPDNIILEEKKRFYFKFNCDETNQDYIDISMQIDHNNNLISSIPKEKRIKVFEFTKDNEAIELIKRKHAKAKEYYENLELKDWNK